MRFRFEDIVSTRFAKIVLPFIFAAVFILFIRFYFIISGLEDSFGKLLVLMLAYFIPPLGKESIIPIGVAGGELSIPFVEGSIVVSKIDPFLMALCIAFVDIIVALFLMWNYDLAKKIPLVGKFMAKVESVGRSSSDTYGWVKPLRFVGIVLFVMVPFQGSGGLVGSIVGRLIGMSPRNTFCAISIGAVVGCLLIAYFSEGIISLFKTNLLQGLFILIVLFIVGVMVWIYRNNMKKS